MKYSKLFVINLIISYILSGIIIIVAGINDFFNNTNVFEQFFSLKVSEEMEVFGCFIIVGFLFFLTLNLFFLPIHLIKTCFVAKNVINKKYTDTKESIYTRDLPEYNSAISGELLDFKTTFQEEYIAGVIELISKGYIIENESSLIVDKTKSTERLFKNEKYILETCETIDSMSYAITSYGFYKKLKEDMFDLGLYKKNIFINKIMYYIKKYDRYSFLAIYILIFILLLCLIMNFFVSFTVSAVLFLVITILIRINKLTKKGELEKEKIGKLKLFLEKQTNFKNKTEAERELWGRYSAFAVAFGLNEEMKEEIMKKIIIFT